MNSFKRKDGQNATTVLLYDCEGKNTISATYDGVLPVMEFGTPVTADVSARQFGQATYWTLNNLIERKG